MGCEIEGEYGEIRRGKGSREKGRKGPKIGKCWEGEYEESI